MKAGRILRLFLTVYIMIQCVNIRAQIIADHRAVAEFDQIPEVYIIEVKKMLVNISGKSHQAGYTNGMVLLGKIDDLYDVTTYYGDIPGNQTNSLRIGKHENIGEEHYYTTQDAIDSYKDHITAQNSTGNTYHVMGFGWCWDMHWMNDLGGERDPVYNVRWAGASEGGPDGNRRWGLDADDYDITGNRISMDNYLNAVEQYIAFCKENDYPTITLYTTGPVDNYFSDVDGTEKGYQRELKHDYIRSYVNNDVSRILFDYADILCWNNKGEQYIAEWNDNGNNREHPNIHPDNEMDYDADWNIVPGSEDGDHIGEVGALRIAKAMWWVLAKIAGWQDDSFTSVGSDIVCSDDMDFFIFQNDKNSIVIKNANHYEESSLIVYNTLGIAVINQSFTGDMDIDISDLPPDFYVFVLNNKTNKKIKKIIKPY